jgi:beta-galactosidase
LRQRYDNDITQLNRRWFRRYRDFSEVDPADRDAPYSVWSSMLPVIDYEHFRSQTLTGICARWAAWTRAADPDRQADGAPVRPVIIDGTSGLLLEQSVSGRNNDEFATARVPDCDVFGGTFYPKSWGRDLGERPWELMHYYGMSRAAAVAADLLPSSGGGILTRALTGIDRGDGGGGGEGGLAQARNIRGQVIALV